MALFLAKPRKVWRSTNGLERPDLWKSALSLHLGFLCRIQVCWNHRPCSWPPVILWAGGRRTGVPIFICSCKNSITENLRRREVNLNWPGRPPRLPWLHTWSTKRKRWMYFFEVFMIVVSCDRRQIVKLPCMLQVESRAGDSLVSSHSHIECQIHITRCKILPFPVCKYEFDENAKFTTCPVWLQ